LGILLVALLGAFLAFTTGTAEACSKHVGPGNFAHSANIAHEGRHLAQVAAVVTTLKIFKAGHETGGAPCCAGGCHCCGVGCVNGCCAGGLAAIDVAGSNLVPTEGARPMPCRPQGILPRSSLRLIFDLLDFLPERASAPIRQSAPGALITLD
jgi:hypothetical protein